jgi:site-specific DNA-methyltransferase (adenine-specific)
LLAYLCRLITPPGGIVLDPFAGTGTTAAACLQEGFRCVLIEKETEYQEDIARRLDANAPRPA